MDKEYSSDSENKSPRELLNEEGHKKRFEDAISNPVIASREEREMVRILAEIEHDWWGDIESYKSVEDILNDVENGNLVEVLPDENFHLIMRLTNPDLENWQPFLRRETYHLLREVVRRWRNKMNERNLPKNIKLAVTNLTITKAYQREIIKQGKLATDKASHSKGQSFDIDGCGYYEDDVAVNPRFTENYKEVYRPEVHELLKEVLDEMTKEHVLHYILEFAGTDNQSFHITRSPEYNSDK